MRVKCFYGNLRASQKLLIVMVVPLCWRRTPASSSHPRRSKLNVLNSALSACDFASHSLRHYCRFSATCKSGGRRLSVKTDPLANKPKEQ